MAHTNRRAMVVPIAIIGAVIVGCSGIPASPTPTLFLLPTLPPTAVASPLPQSTPDLTAGAEIAGNGPCHHLLWPLEDGATWTYQRTDPGGTREATLISTISPDGAWLMLDDRASTLNCVDGALAGLLPGILGSGHPALGADVTGANPRNSFLPEAAELLPLGTPFVWDMEVDAGGTILLPIFGEAAAQTILSGRLVLFSSAGEVQEVSVPAGTFSALPITQDYLYEIEVQGSDGTPRPLLINTRVDVYFAESVGIVQAIFQGGTVSAPDVASSLDPGTTLALTSYFLP